MKVQAGFRPPKLTPALLLFGVVTLYPMAGRFVKGYFGIVRPFGGFYFVV
jgi:hypothetical protein